jgi:hypothetical protein
MPLSFMLSRSGVGFGTRRPNRKERLMCSIRSVCAVLLAFLLSSTGASAGDYTVAYAIDTGDENDAGKIETCEYTKFCRIKSEKLKLSVLLSFWHPDHDKVDIHVYPSKGRSSACCYFVDGVDSVVRSARGPLIRLRLFEGRRRMGNEFLQSASLGILYLQFSSMK